jgi:oligosaccharide repeat unit polymerase
MTIEYWLLSIIPALLLLLLAWIARLQFKSWLAPSAFFSLYWAFALLAPLLLVPSFYFWPGAAWLLLAFGLILHTGVIFGWFIGANLFPLRPLLQMPKYKLIWGEVILISCAALGMLALPLIFQSRGYSLSVLVNLNQIPELSREFSIARYAEAYDPPLVARFLTTFPYLGTMFSGVWIATVPSWSRRSLALWPFVPLIIQTLILTTRSTIIIPTFLAASAYGATLVLRKGDRKLLSVAQLVRISLILAGGFGAFIVLQILRDGVAIDDISTAVNKTLVALLGSPAIFSNWLENQDIWKLEPKGGIYTLAGIIQILGFTERLAGLYDTSIELNMGDDILKSNVYTAFRGLIEDFTLLGVLSLLLIIGITVGLAYRLVAKGIPYGLPMLALFYAFTLWSGVVSILNYNSLFFAWLLFFLCFLPFGPRLLRRLPSSETKQGESS